jgi:hypothetical protein
VTSGSTVAGLVEKIVTSTPNTCRTLLVVLLVCGGVFGGLWLLRANLTAGPISITGRDAPSATTVCPAPSSESAVSCAR